MSKLTRHVYAATTHEQKPTKQPLSAITVTEDWQNHAVATKYRLGVSIEHHAWITTSPRMDGAALTRAIRTVKRSIIEDIFGEFRPHFSAIETALLEEDIDAAREALRVMHHHMFSEEA